MPRAYGVFQAIGWKVLAYPVDYETAPGRPRLIGFDFLNSLVRLSAFTKEALGLAYYRMRGWTEVLYPAIEPSN